MTAWERYLETAEIADPLRMVRRRTSPVGASLRRWIRANACRRYVPEDVLAAMGIRDEDLLRFSRLDRQERQRPLTNTA